MIREYYTLCYQNIFIKKILSNSVTIINNQGRTNKLEKGGTRRGGRILRKMNSTL